MTQRLRGRLIISAPFGNYITLSGHAVPTLGTFTFNRRGGVLYRIWRVLRTVRYYHRLGAWVNKLGLPNPGIWGLEKRVAGGFEVSDKIVSIKGFDLGEWTALTHICVSLDPLAVELNISCPNLHGHRDDSLSAVFTQVMLVMAERTSIPVIVKLPPVNYEVPMEQAYEAGIRIFHCCNTLPVPHGGMSGKPLKPLSLAAVRYAKSFPDALIIGGGGITSVDDAKEYLAAGADSVAVASMLFNPFNRDKAMEIAKFMWKRTYG